MIKIYGYLVDPSYIIGVGPLVQVPSFSAGISDLHVIMCYHFDLYLTNYKIEITTNSVRIDRADKKAVTAELERFRVMYQQLVDDRANLTPLHVNFGA